MRIIQNLFLVLIICVCLGCQQEEPNRLPISDYFLLKEGQEYLYEVNEISYSAGVEGGVEQHYIERRLVKEIDIAAHKQKVIYEIYKGVVAGADTSWSLQTIDYIEITPAEVIKTTNNIPIRTLVQPITHLGSWNGNVYNNLAPQNFTYQIDASSSELKVLENEKSTLIDKYSKFQIYKKGIGITYEEDIALEYCQASHCMGNYVIESGFIKTKTLIKVKDS